MASKPLNRRAGELTSGQVLAVGFKLVQLEDLKTAEADKITNFLSAVAPSSGLIGVYRGLAAWDLRPVIAVPHEDSPSVLRMLGPDVGRSLEVSSVVRQSFESLQRSASLTADFREWGEFDRQLWYRRALVNKTLAHMLDAGEVSLKLGALLFQALVEELSVWHQRGVIHGHLSTTNIFVTPGNGIVLLDPAVGAARICATKGAKAGLLPFAAPELIERQALSDRADSYGLGKIVEILLNVCDSKGAERTKKSLQKIKQDLLYADPFKRPIVEDLLPLVHEFPREELDTPVPDLPIVEPLFVQEKEVIPEVIIPIEKPKIVPPPVPLEEEEFFLSIDDILEQPETKTTAKVVDSAAKDIFDPLFNTEPKSYTQGRDLLGEWDDEEEKILEKKPTEFRSPEPKAAGNSFAVYFIVVGCLLLGIWYYFRGVNTGGTVDYSMRQLKVDWESKIPSRMITVAQIATESGVDNKLVQDFIVSAAKNGTQLPVSVNASLLRVAFHDRWEMELKSEDRRMAVALGLAGLLKDKLPADLGPLTDRHPGVVLAITATAGDNTKKILEKIPAMTLTNLPPPFGAAFQKLLENDSELTCASDAVHLLAMFGTISPEQIKSQEVLDYLSKDATKRLQALALIVSYDDLAAGKVLDIIYNELGQSLGLPEIAWAKTWDLLRWNEVENADKLFILSGIASGNRIGVERIRILFSHPNPKMRSYAIVNAKEKIGFKHPASVVVLDKIIKDPELLDGEQLLRLAEILQDPDKVSDERIKSWLNTSPEPEIVSEMLLSTSASNVSSRTDTWFAYYLKGQKWSPDLPMLTKLTTHPDSYTRLYSYTLLQNRVLSGVIKEEQAKTIIANALSHEADPEFAKQLELMQQQFNK